MDPKEFELTSKGEEKKPEESIENKTAESTPQNTAPKEEPNANLNPKDSTELPLKPEEICRNS